MIEDAVAEFRGTYLQQPPAFSAKKIDGDRAYDLARRNAPVRLQPVEVTATGARRPRVARHARCACAWCAPPATTCARWPTRSANGSAPAAHLAGLVRTRSGDFTLAEAVGLDVLDRRPQEAAARVIPLAALLPSLPAITLTPEGASLAARGGFIGPSHVSRAASPPPREAAVCVCCTPTGTWWPSPSRAPAGVRRVFCIQAWYWNKIARLGLTHCGGLGTASADGSAGPHAEVSIRGTQ